MSDPALWAISMLTAFAFGIALGVLAASCFPPKQKGR